MGGWFLMRLMGMVVSRSVWSRVVRVDLSGSVK